MHDDCNDLTPLNDHKYDTKEEVFILKRVESFEVQNIYNIIFSFIQDKKMI